jgi:hypothetical protein
MLIHLWTVMVHQIIAPISKNEQYIIDEAKEHPSNKRYSLIVLQTWQSLSRGLNAAPFTSSSLRHVPDLEQPVL